MNDHFQTKFIVYSLIVLTLSQLWWGLNKSQWNHLFDRLGVTGLKSELWCKPITPIFKITKSYFLKTILNFNHIYFIRLQFQNASKGINYRLQQGPPKIATYKCHFVTLNLWFCISTKENITYLEKIHCQYLVERQVAPGGCKNFNDNYISIS